MFLDLAAVSACGNNCPCLAAAVLHPMMPLQPISTVSVDYVLLGIFKYAELNKRIRLSLIGHIPDI